MGHALCGASATASGPSTSSTCGRRAGRATAPSWPCPAARGIVPTPAWTPKPTLARPSGSGNDQKYPGSRSGFEPHPQLGLGRPGHIGEVLAERMPVAEVARLLVGRDRPTSLRIGDHVPSAAIDVAGSDEVRCPQRRVGPRRRCPARPRPRGRRGPSRPRRGRRRGARRRDRCGERPPRKTPSPGPSSGGRTRRCDPRESDHAGRAPSATTHGRRVEAEGLENAEGARGQAVATALVAGEPRLGRRARLHGRPERARWRLPHRRDLRRPRRRRSDARGSLKLRAGPAALVDGRVVPVEAGRLQLRRVRRSGRPAGSPSRSRCRTAP